MVVLLATGPPREHMPQLPRDGQTCERENSVIRRTDRARPNREPVKPVSGQTTYVDDSEVKGASGVLVFCLGHAGEGG